MQIKITPQYSNTGPAEKLEFDKFIQNVQLKLGYHILLLHYTDGSILVRLPPSSFLKNEREENE